MPLTYMNQPSGRNTADITASISMSSVTGLKPDSASCNGSTGVKASPPGKVRADGDGGFALPGSPLPLLLMLAVFALRYAVTVSLVLHPQWRVEAGFALPASVAAGFLAGLFAARARRILGTSSGGPRAASA